MSIPQNKTQTILLWIASFAVGVLIAFLSSISQNWPENGDILWRSVWLDTITYIVAALPVVAVGLGLPRFGGEARAALIDKIGKEKATTILEQAADIESRNIYSGVDYGRLADEILKRKAQDDLLKKIP